jgi:serine/threonine-protein kinase
MTLAPGVRLGSYEVLSPIGAGGMGEVYRARDTRLNRDAAIKVLPGLFASDRDRLARFEREAQMLAALNHPRIATIYGLEEAGPVLALAMELVEGPTLAERLANGPIDVAEALSLARDMAEALEYAHERSIIHRDLKPANIKITPDGSVKILDFGLAKALSPTPASTNLANSPTVSVAGTAAGVLLGTAAYMAPEQARGQIVDRRADIWAFGCVLYEMLAGRAPFAGETLTDVLASVVTREPNWDAVPAAMPPRIVALLRRCLRKEPRDRLRDIGDARIEIEEVLKTPPAPSMEQRPARALVPARIWLSAGLAGLLLGVLAVGTISRVWRAPPPRVRVPIRLNAALPEKVGLALGRGSAVAISPDGLKLVFVAGTGGRTGLYLRSLDQFDSTALPGTDGAANPFFSPDGQWVGFFAGGKLKKIALSGGQPVSVCDAPSSRGEAWSLDDVIFFTPSSGSGLWRVAAGGGKPEEVTKRQEGELSHRWPQVLPDGRTVIFTVWNDTGFEAARIVAQSLTTGERRVLVEGGSYARIVFADAAERTGYLIYARASGLLAAPFDAERLQLTGPPVPMVDGVVTNLSGGAHFSVSRDGALVYIAGGLAESARRVAVVDRKGTARPLATIRGMSLFFQVSPDGKRLARSNPAGPNRDIWIHDLDRNTATRLTYRDNSSYPIWTPDGTRVVFSSGLPDPNLYWKSADGSGAEERLTTSPHAQFPGAFSPDGTILVYVENRPSAGSDLWILPFEGDRTPRPFLQTPFNESEAAFSPDGKWLAYQSNESGVFEVYVQSFPSGGRKWQISTDGGRWPLWARNGREIFYRNRNGMMAVAVGAEPAGSGTALTVDKPRLLFEGSFEDVYSLTPDERFVVIQIDSDESAPTEVHVVLDWLEELKRRIR